jgi:hypothetical protein
VGDTDAASRRLDGLLALAGDPTALRAAIVDDELDREDADELLFVAVAQVASLEAAGFGAGGR